MNKTNPYKLLQCCLFASLLPCAIQASPDLIFPATRIEPSEHVYELDSSRSLDSGLVGEIKSENLASNLLEMLRQPSKSCRESASAKKAMDLIAKNAGALDIELKIDNLPEKVTMLSAQEKADVYCDNGRTAPESGNLIGFIPANISAPSWNLSFHLDTNQLLFDGFKREGDLIKPAPGTPLGADDKAGIAIVAEIIRVISEKNISHGDIRIVGLVAEEDSAVGARLVEADAFKGDILVSIDGTDPDEIGRAAPTMYNGYITVATQTSHPASVDEKLSVSACALGAKILNETGFRPDAHPPAHPNVVLHTYFTSCGVNKKQLTAKGEPVAAYQYNTISPFWTAAWQMRNLEGSAAAEDMVKEMAERIRLICEEAGTGRSIVNCMISGTDAPKLSGYIVSENAASIRLLDQAFKASGDKPVRITSKQFGGFNGNFIKARFDEEMIIVGTGADQIHTNEETVSIAGMSRVARGLLMAMLESYRYRLVK